MLREVDDDSFEKVVMQGSKLVLVDFWSPRCGPCYALARELEALQTELGDRLLIVKINVDENPQIRGEYEIYHLPSLGFFQNGELVRFIGGLGKKSALRKELGL